MSKKLNLRRHLQQANPFRPQIILASSSRYRRELLQRLNLPFASLAPDIDETPFEGETAHATARRLAEGKARAIAIKHIDAYIIASDQVAVLNGKLLGKPGNRGVALAQLSALRGRSVVFHTAVCLLEPRNGRCQIEDVPTTVHYRKFTEAQALRYVEAEPAYDCAGSAKIESLGIALVERVESTDPTALIGLPLITVVNMLAEAGIEILSPNA
jgi:septum formation protein